MRPASVGIDGLKALERLAILKERNARHQRDWRKRQKAERES